MRRRRNSECACSTLAFDRCQAEKAAVVDGRFSPCFISAMTQRSAALTPPGSQVESQQALRFAVDVRDAHLLERGLRPLVRKQPDRADCV